MQAKENIGQLKGERKKVGVIKEKALGRENKKMREVGAKRKIKEKLDKAQADARFH